MLIEVLPELPRVVPGFPGCLLLEVVPGIACGSFWYLLLFAYLFALVALFMMLFAASLDIACGSSWYCQGVWC